jgi:amino-acid N-acetyltransferase
VAVSKTLRSDPASASFHKEGYSLHVRKAILSDVGPLLRLINGYASLGMMLPKTEFELSEGIRDFTLALSGSQMVGCGALHFYGPTTGEVRSLAVDTQWRNRGVGRRLMEGLDAEARANGLHLIFAFTYVPDFFGRLGFVEADRGELPSKVWKDCLRCPKFQCCDEIAMRKILEPQVKQRLTTPTWGGTGLEDNGVILLPTVRKHSESQ